MDNKLFSNLMDFMYYDSEIQKRSSYGQKIPKSLADKMEKSKNVVRYYMTEEQQKVFDIKYGG